MDQLDAAKIRRDIQVAPIPQVQTFASINSTQTYCHQQRFIKPHVIVANRQTQGRGQRGHHFYSPQNHGIYLTVVLPATQRLIRNPGILTAGAGVAVVQALMLFTNQSIGLKWMNDIECRHRKCGGILVETNSDDVNRIRSWLIGIGLDLDPQEFPRMIQTRAGSLFQETRSFTRNQLIAKIYDYLIRISQLNRERIIQEYQTLMIWRHRWVTFNLANQQRTGVILGIDSRARLIIRDQTGRSHRLNYLDASQIRLA